MWQIFQKILTNKLTPNQCLILYGIHKKIAVNVGVDEDLKYLLDEGFILDNKLTAKSKKIIIEIDNYFVKSKKKTDIQLMGKDYANNIKLYREIFPAKKLPSGKPARNNVKILGESFRWFFETFDHTWDTVIKATRMYVNEYRDNGYLYMQTSQYFVCKQDKHKVKHSSLADYCDMIIDGVSTEDDHFTEKVV